MSAEWQFLVTLNETLRPLRKPVEIQELAVRLMGEHLQANQVHYAHIEGDEFVVSHSYARGVAPFAGRGQLSRFGTAMVAACRHGETVVVNDTHTDPRFTDAERERLLAIDIAACVAVPLIKEGRWIAVFSVHSATPRCWTDDQIALVEVSAERTWASGERARAEQALTWRDARAVFLRTLNERIRGLGDPARILEEACRLLGMHMLVNRVIYAEIDGDECTVASDYANGVPSMVGRFRWAELVGSRTDELLQGHTLIANDTSIEASSSTEREALQAAGIGAYLCPVLVKDGRLVGAFGVHSREPREWTAAEIALVEDVAERIWSTLEHRKAEAELRSNEERLEFLLRLNDALRPLSDPGEVQETAARLLGQHLGASRVGYAEFDASGGYAIRREYARGVPPLVGQPPGIALGKELIEALRRGETIVVHNVQTDPRLNDAARATLQTRHIAALIGISLFKGERMVASFGANNATPRVWTPSEVELVADVAARTWDAVERTRAQAALREQQQRLRLALEASAGGSWSWIAGSDQVDWDERFRPLYGLSPDEPATPDAWLSRVHDDDRERLLALREEMWTSRTKDSWESTYRIVRPDGTLRWIQSRGRVDRDADGNVTRLTGLDLDFTEHRRREDARGG